MVNEQAFPDLDAWIIDALETAMPTPEQVHDGLVTLPRSAPGEPVVVRYELPYVTFTSSVGAVSNRRLAGRVGRHSAFWSLMFVGETREQTIACGQVCRNALLDVRPQIEHDTLGEYRFWPIELEESQRVYRDDDAVNIGGNPLFYGVDNYSVAHIIKRTA